MIYKYINSIVESEIKKGAQKATRGSLGIINIFFGIKIEREEAKKDICIVIKKRVILYQQIKIWAIMLAIL